MKKGTFIDYHDYVFKDGKLIGAFEEMYRYSTEIPWHQDDAAFKIFSEIDLAILRQNPYDTILDVGCGLGYFTERLRKELSNSRRQRPKVMGVDISRAAIEKAKKMFRMIDFKVMDIREQSLSRKFDLIIVKELLWCIFEHLEKMLQNIEKMMKRRSWLYISQAFPEKEDYVGKEVIRSPFHLKEIFEERFKVEYYCIEWDSTYQYRPYIHILCRGRNES